MGTMTTRSQVTNQRVADDLEITHSSVSRIRSGDRFPSLTLIKKIEHTLGWSLTEQVALLGSVKYAEKFEEVLVRRYDVGVLDVTGPAH